MNMRSVIKRGLALLAVGVLGVTLIGCGAANPERKAAKNGYKTQKVVYHLNDKEQGVAALRNIKNHLNALGDENVEIIAVMHSSGAFVVVDGATDAKGRTFSDAVQQLANRGVKFQICANTIRGKKIDKNKINLNATVTPSGVATVAELQYDGYVYVKP